MATDVSTWVQVIFAGMGVAIALVALIIAYFAWIRPHAPQDDPDRAAPVPAPSGPAAPSLASSGPAAPGSASSGPVGTTGFPPAASTVLTGLTPTIGGSDIRTRDGDVALPCATGQTGDRQRTVEWDLRGLYASLRAELLVSEARDDDTSLQMKIFADGRQVGNHVVRRTAPARVEAALDGKQKLRVQLTCQFPDGEVVLRSATLTR